MDDTTILGSTLGQLGQTVKQTAKQVVKLPEEMARDAGGQLGVINQDKNGAQEDKPQSQWKSDEERIKFLKDLYGSSDQNSTVKQNPSEEVVSSVKPSADAKAMADKEEQRKLMEFRNQLHKENYYDPTFNPKNPSAGGEERPAEKVENEKKQEMQDLQKKEERKPPPLAVVREQNKAEMFRGAAG